MNSAGLAIVERSPRSMLGGISLCILLAAGAQQLHSLIAIPTMLAALMFGIGVRAIFSSFVTDATSGIEFCFRTLLRVGIALLGFRIVAADVLSLGWSTAAVILCSLIATLCGGYLIARILDQPSDVSAISATSVAVCGASAALAASAVMPSREGLTRETTTVIVVVSLLSTIVMVAYPLLIQAVGFDAYSTAVILGAAIHDVAQVAGAGFAVSPAVGLDAVAVKMVRVACLLPVIFAVGIMARTPGCTAETPSTTALIPPFLVVFLLAAALANTGLLPRAVIDAGGQGANWALTTAVAALGLQTRLSEVSSMQPKLLLALALQTIWQLGCVVFLLFAFS